MSGGGGFTPGVFASAVAFDIGDLDRGSICLNALLFTRSGGECGGGAIDCLCTAFCESFENGLLDRGSFGIDVGFGCGDCGGGGGGIEGMSSSFGEALPLGNGLRVLGSFGICGLGGPGGGGGMCDIITSPGDFGGAFGCGLGGGAVMRAPPLGGDGGGGDMLESCVGDTGGGAFGMLDRGGKADRGFG